jgi:uncharacterized protein DUF1097
VKLKPLQAGALAAALFAAVAVWAFAAYPGLLVWGAFIGWASYDHSGADRKALYTSSVCMVFGVVMAWLVAVIVAEGWLHLRSSVSSAIAAGLASYLIVLASRFEPFSNVPATFYGFASAFAFLTLTPQAFSISAMTRWSLKNVLVAVPVSLLIGSALGILQGFVAGRLATAGHGDAVSRPLRLSPLQTRPH